MRVKSGSYTGTGTANSVNIGVGFPPALAIVRADHATNGQCWWLSSAFSAPASGKICPAAAYDSAGNGITALGSTYFTVTQQCNIVSVVYYWTAFEADAAVLAVGTFAGDNTDNRNITAPFQPDFVLVQKDSASGTDVYIWNSALGGDHSVPLNDAGGSVANYIQGVGAGSFQVGTALNATGSNYFWFALKATVGNVVVGSYVGTGVYNDVANTNLNAIPLHIIVMNGGSASAGYGPCQRNFALAATDGGWPFQTSSGSVATIDTIDYEGSNDFLVRNSNRTNKNGTTYYYLCVQNPQAYTVEATADIRVATGSYVGNAGTNVISGLGFVPAVIMFFKDAGGTSNDCGFKFNYMPWDYALDGQPYGVMAAGRVTIDADGFILGSNTLLNANGATYYYIALAGTKVASGCYIGNNVDNRNITTPFQSCFVDIHQSGEQGGATWAGWYAALGGDNSILRNIGSSAPIADVIQGVGSTYFQVGTSGNGYKQRWHWLAVATVTGGIYQGSFTGNASDNRNITMADAFQPDVVHIVPPGSAFLNIKPSALAGDATLAFGNSGGKYGAKATDYIQSLRSDGFQVGTNGQANGSAKVMQYLALKNVSGGTYPVPSRDLDRGRALMAPVLLA